MKSKASTFLKQMVSTIVAVVKSKSTAARVKASALKTRLLILGILRNKKLLMTAINHKIHAIMGQQQQQQDGGDHHHGASAGDSEEGGGSGRKAIVPYRAPSYSFSAELGAHDEAESQDSDEYLTHSLFAEADDEDELVSAPGSVIDVMRDAREREAGDGAEFRLEDEIETTSPTSSSAASTASSRCRSSTRSSACARCSRGAPDLSWAPGHLVIMSPSSIHPCCQ